MEEQPSLASLSTTDWRNILNAHHDSNIAIFKHARDYKAILKAFFRCKIASKKLNLLLNDQFFFNVFQDRKWRPYKRLLLKKRMNTIICAGDFAQYQNFYDLASKYHLKGYLSSRSFDQLLLIVEKTDVHFLRKLIELHFSYFISGQRLLNLDLDFNTLWKAIKYACQQENNEKVEYLLRLLRRDRYTTGLDGRIEAVSAALSVPGKKITINSYFFLMQIAHTNYTRVELQDQIDRLFAVKKEDQPPVIVPAGELLYMGKLSQSKQFNRKHNRANFRVKYKEGNHVTLMYRDVNGTQHSIPIATTTDQSGAITQFSFGSESRATLSSLILHHSLSSLIFADYPHQLIAVTRQLLSLPYEQQPWFRGMVPSWYSKYIELILEPGSAVVFYTYCLGDKIYLQFSHANSLFYAKNNGGDDFKQRVEIILGEDISKYFPRDKLVLGLHNGGEINGLAEHLIWQAVFMHELDIVKEIVAKKNLDLKTSKFLNTPENLIDKYSDEKIADSAVILWLVENGAELPSDPSRARGIFDKVVRFPVAQECDEKLFRALVPKITLNFRSIYFLIDRGCSYDTLKFCWKYSPHAHGSQSVIPTLMRNIGKKFSGATYKNRALIMTAWKLDQNCHFRQLPKEIVLEILSYDNIDEPPYWDFLDFVIKTAPAGYLIQLFGFPGFQPLDWAKFAPLVWENWDEPSYAKLATELVKALTNLQYESIPQDICSNLLSWTLKFLRRSEDPPKLDRDRGIFKYCLKTPSPLTLSILTELIEKNSLSAELLYNCNYFAHEGPERILMPTIFFAVMSENTPALQLLIERGLWRENDDKATRDLAQLMQRFPDKKHVKKFIDECLQRKSKLIKETI